MSDQGAGNIPVTGDEHVLLQNDEGAWIGEASTQQIADLAPGGSGDLSDAVILAPTDSARNKIKATATDAIPLTIEQVLGQTVALLAVLAPLLPASFNDIANEQTYTAILAGTVGNGITVRLSNDGPNIPLTLSEVGTAVTIHLATDGAENVTSTVQDVATLIQTSTLITTIANENFVGSDLAVASGVQTLAGGFDEGFTKVLPGGNLVVHGGDPALAALEVLGDQAGVQTGDLFRATCNGYGIKVKYNGVVETINDDEDPCIQSYANDGSDLAFELGGTGIPRFPLAGIATSGGEPADADINPGECFRYFIPTNGAAKTGFKGKTLDGTVVKREDSIP